MTIFKRRGGLVSGIVLILTGGIIILVLSLIPISPRKPESHKPIVVEQPDKKIPEKPVVSEIESPADKKDVVILPPSPRPKPIPEEILAQFLPLKPADWQSVKAGIIQDKGWLQWAKALEMSAGYYRKRPAKALYRFGNWQVSASDMALACEELAKVARLGDPARLFSVLEKRYLLFHSIGRNSRGDVLVTSYYEPLLHGSMVQTDRFRFPLYERPDDLVSVDLGLFRAEWKGERITGRNAAGKLIPYYDRDQIDHKRVLRDKKLELVWVDSLADQFFLQIQGSGRVKLYNEDGKPLKDKDGLDKMLRVGYAASNGQPYRSLGKLLIEEGRIPASEMSLPKLKQWLSNHPDEMRRVFAHNPSYVFFREIKGGPYGNIGVALTAERSIASDWRIFPKGAPAILISTFPHFPEGTPAQSGWQKAQWKGKTQLVVNQDTGGAIVGPGRVDFFMGFGDRAEMTAGIMKQGDSSLYFIAPKPIVKEKPLDLPEKVDEVLPVKEREPIIEKKKIPVEKKETGSSIELDMKEEEDQGKRETVPPVIKPKAVEESPLEHNQKDKPEEKSPVSGPIPKLSKPDDGGIVLKVAPLESLQPQPKPLEE
ncbi:MltA domain-containing protein [Magnetococcales bacterium HHB-1]